MTQHFSRVRDIIDDYEWFWLPIIKKELAECENERDYVYGKLLKYKGKQISRNGLFEQDVENTEVDNSQQEMCDIASTDYNKIVAILHSQKHITFTSPNPHQKRWYGKLGKIVNALKVLEIQDWRFTNFEHLYDVVRSVFLLKGHSHAILTMYDTALRIGYNHAEQILPSKFVYLYGTSERGPLYGATVLYGPDWIDKHIDKDYEHRIKARWFADKFPNLPSWEIESILCIYANQFFYDMPY